VRSETQALPRGRVGSGKKSTSPIRRHIASRFEHVRDVSGDAICLSLDACPRHHRWEQLRRVQRRRKAVPLELLRGNVRQPGRDRVSVILSDILPVRKRPGDLRELLAMCLRAGCAPVRTRQWRQSVFILHPVLAVRALEWAQNIRRVEARERGPWRGRHANCGLPVHPTVRASSCCWRVLPREALSGAARRFIGVGALLLHQKGLGSLSHAFWVLWRGHWHDRREWLRSSANGAPVFG